MAIGGIDSSTTQNIAMLQRPEASEVTQGGRDRVPDSDRDDGGMSVQPPTPVVNSQGQTIGGTIDVTA